MLSSRENTLSRLIKNKTKERRRCLCFSFEQFALSGLFYSSSPPHSLSVPWTLILINISSPQPQSPLKVENGTPKPCSSINLPTLSVIARDLPSITAYVLPSQLSEILEVDSQSHTVLNALQPKGSQSAGSSVSISSPSLVFFFI